MSALTDEDVLACFKIVHAYLKYQSDTAETTYNLMSWRWALAATISTFVMIFGFPRNINPFSSIVVIFMIWMAELPNLYTMNQRCQTLYATFKDDVDALATPKIKQIYSMTCNTIKTYTIILVFVFIMSAETAVAAYRNTKT